MPIGSNKKPAQAIRKGGIFKIQGGLKTSYKHFHRGD